MNDTNTVSFKISGGSVIGNAHQKALRNNQDAFCIRESNNWIVGVVSDGCSGNIRSEINAYKTVNYLSVKALSILENRNQFNFEKNYEKFLNELYSTYLSWLYFQIEAQFYDIKIDPNVMNFIKNEFIMESGFSTILFFALNKNSGDIMYFSRGDGGICKNEELSFIQQNNVPAYPIYNIIDPSASKEILIGYIHDADWQRFAIMSDGAERSEKESLFGNIFNPLNDKTEWLQSNLRFVKTYKKNESWDDDFTVITVQKVGQKVESEVKNGTNTNATAG